MPQTASAHRLPAVLWPLMFGNVVIGMGVMVVAGLLNDIRSALDISISTAGQLISAAALLVSLGAPLLAMLVARWDRRRLLVGSLLWFALFHTLAAWAPGFDSLLISRVLAMVSAAIFTPQAAACIGLLVPAQLRGRGITFVFLGWSVASVLGTPLGAWIGGTFGWRWTMGLMAVLSLVAALWLQLRMPKGIVPPPLSASAWRQTLLSSTLMLTLGITVLSAAGQFVLFSYIAPYVADRFGLGATALSTLLLVYGLCGFAGNAMVSRWIDRIGPPRAMAWALGAGQHRPGHGVGQSDRWLCCHAAGHRAMGSRRVCVQLVPAGTARGVGACAGTCIDCPEHLGHVCRAGHWCGQRRCADPAAGAHKSARGWMRRPGLRFDSESLGGQARQATPTPHSALKQAP